MRAACRPDEGSTPAPAGTHAWLLARAPGPRPAAPGAQPQRLQVWARVAPAAERRARAAQQHVRQRARALQPAPDAAAAGRRVRRACRVSAGAGRRGCGAGPRRALHLRAQVGVRLTSHILINRWQLTSLGRWPERFSRPRACAQARQRACARRWRPSSDRVRRAVRTGPSASATKRTRTSEQVTAGPTSVGSAR